MKIDFSSTTNSKKSKWLSTFGEQKVLSLSPQDQEDQLRWPQQALVRQGIALGAAPGFEEGPAQLSLAHLRDCSTCCQCPGETTPQRQTRAETVSSASLTAQAKERAALLWSAIKEKNKIINKPHYVSCLLCQLARITDTPFHGVQLPTPTFTPQ